MSHWGSLPRLTTEFVPQCLHTVKASHKEEKKSPLGAQQHTMIIYIIISSEVLIQQHEYILIGDKFSS